MQCTKPILISKHGVRVPCGKCLNCRIARAREWSIRIMHEVDYHPANVFATLTYDDDHLPSDNSLKKSDLSRFWKRLRKDLGDRRIKYFGCGEYGERFGRPHYHAIIFGVAPDEKGLLESNWPYGFVHVGTVTYDSARYVADYVSKVDGALATRMYGYRTLPFKVQSNGLGRQFALDNEQYLRDNLKVTAHGSNHGVPKYYRKVLDLPGDLWEPAAVERSAEVQDFHIDKSGPLASGVSLNASRRQHARNTQARVDLYKKGSL